MVQAVEFVGPVFKQSEERVRGASTEWAIRGYDGTIPLVDERVSSRDLGPRGITELLRRLASRHLTEVEIIAANTGEIPHLDLSRVSQGWMTNGDPHYVAVVIEPEE